MCGIAGCLSLNEVPPHEADVSAMLAPMICRGPDGSGVKAVGPAVLGHRRLSIIDLAGGAQPLDNEDGSVWVTFNGEIFNYRELRQHLSGRGHRFKTDSDTETLVHLYEEYGAGLTARCRGFRQFLATADKDRLEMLIDENPDYYFDVLPYAHALRVSAVWLEKTGDIGTRLPEWFSVDSDSSNAITSVMMNRLDSVAAALRKIRR